MEPNTLRAAILDARANPSKYARDAACLAADLSDTIELALGRPLDAPLRALVAAGADSEGAGGALTDRVCDAALRTIDALWPPVPAASAPDPHVANAWALIAAVAEAKPLDLDQVALRYVRAHKIDAPVPTIESWEDVPGLLAALRAARASAARLKKERDWLEHVLRHGPWDGEYAWPATPEEKLAHGVGEHCPCDRPGCAEERATAARGGTP